MYDVIYGTICFLLFVVPCLILIGKLEKFFVPRTVTIQFPNKLSFRGQENDSNVTFYEMTWEFSLDESECPVIIHTDVGDFSEVDFADSDRMKARGWCVSKDEMPLFSCYDIDLSYRQGYYHISISRSCFADSCLAEEADVEIYLSRRIPPLPPPPPERKYVTQVVRAYYYRWNDVWSRIKLPSDYKGISITVHDKRIDLPISEPKLLEILGTPLNRNVYDR